LENNRSLPLLIVLLLGFILIDGIIFAILAEDVADHEILAMMDPVFGQWLISHTTPLGTAIFSAITFLGNYFFISLCTVVIGIILILRTDWDQLVFLILAVRGAAFLNLVLKQVFLRPRPDFPQSDLTAFGFSFPSGHTMMALAFYGAVACIVIHYSNKRLIKISVTIGAVITSLLVGFSRLYLGVHYLTDVMAGFAASGAWLAVCILAITLVDFNAIGERIKNYLDQQLMKYKNSFKHKLK